MGDGDESGDLFGLVGGHCGEREKEEKRRLLQILTDTVVGGEDTVLWR
jgi:hypothetical protein